MTHEHLDPQLVLQGLDLLGDSGLRGMQRLGRLGDIQAAAGDFRQAAQLLKLHMLYKHNILTH